MYAALFAFLCFADPAVESDPLVGTTVIIIADTTLVPEAPSADEPVALRRGDWCKLESAAGDRLIVEHDGTRGPLGRSLVLPPNKALPFLTEAIERQPTATAHFTRALLRLERLEYAQARQDLDESARLDPSIGEVLYFRASLRAIGQDFDGAIADASEAIRLGLRNDQSLAGAYQIRGTAKYKQGRTSEVALADLDEALRLDPECVDGLIGRGAVRMIAGDFDRARADLAEALRLQPDRLDARANLAALFVQQGDYDGAIAELGGIIERDPLSPVAHQAEKDLAKVYAFRAERRSGEGDDAGANADYGSAIRLVPEATELYSRRASIRRKLGDRRGLIDDLTEVIRREPTNADAWKMRALAWSTLGKLETALGDYDEAIVLRRGDELLYFARAVTRETLGKYEGALADYRTALDNRPDLDAAQMHIAWLLATCPDESIRSGIEAIECGLKLWNAHETSQAASILAAAYAEAHNFGQAIDWQNKAIELAETWERAELEANLALYEARRPYRQTRPPVEARKQ